MVNRGDRGRYTIALYKVTDSYNGMPHRERRLTIVSTGTFWQLQWRAISRPPTLYRVNRRVLGVRVCGRGVQRSTHRYPRPNTLRERHPQKPNMLGVGHPQQKPYTMAKINHEPSLPSPAFSF